jgi:hypothetical protein
LIWTEARHGGGAAAERPGAPARTAPASPAAAIDVRLPSPDEPVIALEVDLDPGEGNWLVLRVSDPSLPADSRATGQYARLGRGIAYTSPSWLERPPQRLTVPPRRCGSPGAGTRVQGQPSGECRDPSNGGSDILAPAEYQAAVDDDPKELLVGPKATPESASG